MKRKYWVFLIFCIGILFLDQWTKSLVVQNLPPYQRREVIHGFFNLIHMRNPGGAFGIFGGERDGIGSLFFIGISLTAILAIIYIFIRLREGEKILVLSFSLILSGAIGNLVDRLRYGEVVDFLQFYLPFLPWQIFNPWPTFNVADSAICVGIGLMALEFLKRDLEGLKYRKSKRKKSL